MSSSKNWADGPYKLLSTPRAALKVKTMPNIHWSNIDSLSQGESESSASRNASEMALIHNIVLRGLNCITLQANNVKNLEDIVDFMAFCDAWSCVLHSHHNTEETVYFPLLEEQSSEKGVMARNHAEHETFVPGLLALDAYVRSVKDDAKTYDSSKLLKITGDLGPALEAHLRNEIALLESLAKDEKIDWDLLGKTMAAHSKKVADRASIFISGEGKF
jgi:hemerythrin-like domain-containing protein